MHEVHITSLSSTRTLFIPCPSFPVALYSLQNAFRGPLSPTGWVSFQSLKLSALYRDPGFKKGKLGVGVQSLFHRVTRNIKDQMESIVKIF